MDKKSILKKSVNNVWNANDVQFTPAPSTSTGPGGQVPFQRPRATAPTGKVVNKSASIANLRTIPNQLNKPLLNTLPKKELIKTTIAKQRPASRQIPGQLPLKTEFPAPLKTELPPIQ